MDAANLKIGRLQNELLELRERNGKLRSQNEELTLRLLQSNRQIEALNRQVEEFCKQSAAIATSFKDLLS